MANLSNINNKLVLTTDGAALINQGSVDYGSAKLQVSGSGSTGTITWRNDGGRKTGYLYSDSAGIAIYSTALDKAGIYMADDVQIDFRVNGSTPKMIILDSGNVGIGNASPSQKLVVQADWNGSLSNNQQLQIQGNTDTTLQLRLGYDTTNDYAEIAAIKSGTGYKNLILNRGGANVGIGTASPQEKLHIVGLDGSVPLSSYYGSLVVDNNGEAAMSIIGNSYSSIYFGDAATNFAGGVIYEHSSNSMNFRTNGNSEKMRILGNGNVGIGTDLPSSKLTVKDSQDSSFDSGIGIIRSNSSQTGYINMVGGAMNINAPNAVPIKFRDGGNTNVTIGGDGYVGIGTTVTDGGFNVNNTTAGSYYNMSNSDSGNYKYTNPGGRLLTSNATGWFADGRDPILTLSSSGNSENSAIGNSIGLNLYTNSYTYGNFSPLITFSALSDSGSYASAYAVIAGRKTNRGPDTNWNTGDLCFWTTGPEASNPASYMQQTPTMVIKSGGNVGIGTDDPQSKLEVASSDNINNISDGAIQVVSSSPIAFVAPSNLNPSLNRWGFTLREGGEGHFGIRDYRHSSTRVTIDDGGNVGIGVTGPLTKMEINGCLAIGSAIYDGNITRTFTNFSQQNGGSLHINIGLGGGASSGDTITFEYAALSWKSWSLSYNFASTNGISYGVVGGYWNNSGTSQNQTDKNNLGVSVAVTHNGQSNLITFTFTALGVHAMANFVYMQSGGDGQPIASRVTITANS